MKQTHCFISLGLKLQHGKGKEHPKRELAKLSSLEMIVQPVSIRVKSHSEMSFLSQTYCRSALGREDSYLCSWPPQGALYGSRPP